MKKVLLISLVLVSLSYLSCEKQDSAGNIKGMGETPGQLEVKEAYALPQGIRLIGDITGVGTPVSKKGESKGNPDSKCDCSYLGSGRYVRLQFNLVNIGNVPKTVFFPKGLVCRCETGHSQHALLCQTTWFCLNPNTSRSIYLDLYCINEEASLPDQNSTYKILGVSKSPVIGNLLNLIGWRKINYEMIHGTLGGRKGIAEEPTYDQITERLQNIVWNLTDKGIDLTADDKAFIASIPELSPSEIPVVDENSQFPEYFEEYIVPGK